MVHGLIRHPRSLTIILGLAAAIGFSVVFASETDGFLGTTFQTVSEAVSRSKDGPLSDDVYKCRNLNGMGSDDNIAIGLLWLLLPLMVWRLIRFRTGPGRSETAAFLALSLPAFVLLQSATCARVDLTLTEGRNLALAGSLLGWAISAFAYLWPSRSR